MSTRIIDGPTAAALTGYVCLVDAEDPGDAYVTYGGGDWFLTGSCDIWPKDYIAEHGPYRVVAGGLG